MTSPSFDEVPEGSVGAADNRVWGQVTYRVQEGVGDPPQYVIDVAMQVQCPDCQVNVEIVWDGERWAYLVAHDEPCPWLAALERR